jgi:ribosome-associated protein
VNTTASRVELRCSLSIAGLPASILERIVASLGDNELRVVCSTERSQLRNRRVALERLANRLDEAAEIATERRATRPSRSQREARLGDKKRRASRKADRRWRPAGD